MHPAKRKPAQIFPRYSWREHTHNPSLLYVKDHNEANTYLARLPIGHIGFDIEWRPNFVKGQPENPVALVQLASSDTVILLHLSHMKQFPSQLKELLSSESWIKAGVNIRNDCSKLYKDCGVSVRNCVELSLLARTVDNARWKGKYTEPLGLARLLETYQQATLTKGRVQRSNWELDLDTLQQEYAANDAHAGYIIYSRLINMAQAMDPVPLPTYYSFSVIGGLLYDNSGVVPWQPQNPGYDPGPPPPPKPKTSDTEKRELPGAVPVRRRQYHKSAHQSSQVPGSSMVLECGVAIPLSSTAPFHGGRDIPRPRYQHSQSRGRQRGYGSAGKSQEAQPDTHPMRASTDLPYS